MEKDIGKIPKNPTTDIIVRIDDFGGRRGVTIREFITSDRYTGFSKAGTRISPENFLKFREMINSIDIDELNATPDASEAPASKKPQKGQKTFSHSDEELPDY